MSSRSTVPRETKRGKTTVENRQVACGRATRQRPGLYSQPLDAVF